jgi:phage virion morphogenesis protein
MSGAVVEVDTKALKRLDDRLKNLAKPRTAELLDALGMLIVGQTQRRIHKEKTAPDGTDWQEWSERYAKTRHANHSLLENEGYLVQGMQHVVSGDEVHVGTNMIYGATQQFGRGPIPARPYLGLSAENTDEVVQVCEEFLDSLIFEGIK